MSEYKLGQFFFFAFQGGRKKEGGREGRRKRETRCERDIDAWLPGTPGAGVGAGACSRGSALGQNQPCFSARADALTTAPSRPGRVRTMLTSPQGLPGRSASREPTLHSWPGPFIARALTLQLEQGPGLQGQGLRCGPGDSRVLQPDGGSGAASSAGGALVGEAAWWRRRVRRCAPLASSQTHPRLCHL